MSDKVSDAGGNKPPWGQGEPDRLVTSSHEIARRVLPLLSQLQVPVTPANYRIWYEYFSPGSEEIKIMLNNLLKEGVAFTPELTARIYQQFFSQEASDEQLHSIDQAGERVNELVVETIKRLVSSIAQSDEYSSKLKEKLVFFDKARDLDSVKGALRHILSETDKILKNQAILQSQLEAASQVLVKVQDTLRRSEELAAKDELTGLANRRSFNCRLREEWVRAQRYGSHFSLIMLDIDDFKAVNDTRGHLVGDRLLAMVGKAILGVVRCSDIPARFGGEEFAVICPQTDLRNSLILAERLRRVIDETEFTCRGSKVRATISGGVAMFRPGEESGDLLERVDMSMYLAKKTGKNRICTEDDLLAQG